MTVIKSSDLDFETIKNSLKIYFQQQSEFSDYDFEASGLSNILDVLAYNTHLNGLIANIGVNESFLTSSQLRSSIVSHAENLGYNVRSRTSATATVNLSLTTSDTSTTTITLPANTTFSTSIDDVTYSFQTLEAYVGTNNGSGVFTFATSTGSTTIPIREGTLKTKTFIVGDTTDDQVYVIPDETIDTSTMTVSVFDTTSSSSFTTYTDVYDNVRINTNSTVYIVKETPNGFYELLFSDGTILGKAPVSGNKIVVTYLSNLASAANGGKIFTADDQVSVSGIDYTLNVTTVTNSGAGATKESNASIRLNAPRAYATQQRLVTAEDYKALILQRYSSVLDDVTSWGGNDNEPPIYGRVYVSLKFKSGIDSDTQQTTKDNIVSLLSENLGVMSIDTFYSDPETSFLELSIKFNFDPDQTGTTSQSMETQVKSLVTTYFQNNLNTFGSVFRRSLLLAEIDDLSPAILNSSIETKVQQRLVPTLNVKKDYNLNYPVKIASPDDVNHTVISSRFTFGGVSCTLRNKLNTNTLEIVSQSRVVSTNVGSYNIEKGTVTLTGFICSAFEGDNIRISIVPANQSTIKPLRNYILSVDTASLSALADIDYQNTAVTL